VCFVLGAPVRVVPGCHLPNGDVYVADSAANRVDKFNSSGVSLAKWGRNSGDGSAGSGDGQFANPVGIAVDQTGKVYVSDAPQGVVPPTARRIQKLGPDGTHLATLTTGTPATALAVDGSGHIYGVMPDPAQVWVFDQAGKVLARWGAGAGGQHLQAPTRPLGVAVGPDQGIWVSEPYAGTVLKYRSDGRVLLSCHLPLSLGVAPSELAVTNAESVFAGDGTGLLHLGPVSSAAQLCDIPPVPVATHFAVRPSRFRISRARRHRPVVSNFSYRLSTAARSELNFARRTTHGWQRAGRLTTRGRQGTNRIKFNGWVAGHPLSPGRYRATLHAIDSQGQSSKPRTVSFSIMS
jgi:hypothetical protein